MTHRNDLEELLLVSRRPTHPEPDLRHLLEHLPAGVIVHAPDASILLANQEACRMLGLTCDVATGSIVEDFEGRFVGEDLVELAPHEFPAARIAATRAPLEKLVVGIRSTSSPDVAWALVNGYPEFDRDDKIRQIVIAFVDITERRRAEDRHEKLQTQLVQAQKLESIGRLAGGVAHDFNNMLCVMMGRAEEAMTKLAPSDPVHGHLQEILKAGRKSADLTRQLLGFARKQTVAPRLLDLNETIDGMLKMLRRLIGEDIEIVWRPAKDLRPVRMDPGQVDQILANLCVNARDAIEGAGRLAIETRNTVLDGSSPSFPPDLQPGGFVTLSVADTGCGMSPEIQRQIFEPFFTTKEVGKGTGLGLPMVYGIVKQNRGLVNVHSEVGKGTTFEIHLPAAAGLPSHPVEPATRPIIQGDETILLVEDEPLLLSMTSEMLQAHGYNLVRAGTAKDALEVFQASRHPIDLLISDVVMPNMNGQELVTRLRALRPGLKVLFMSGYTSNIINPNGDIGERTAFIQKPFSMHTLMEKVREALVG